MTILGIDPGLHATGYGVIAASGDRMRLIAAGAVRPSSRQGLARRLQQVYDGLQAAIRTHQPQVVVIESLYTHQQYLTTAALMAHARGVACLLGAQHRLPLVEYLPTRVKKALTGHGTASKDQVARAVGMWLSVNPSSWASDVTDALALAIAHAHISRAAARLPARPASRRRRLPAALAEAVRWTK